MLELQDTLFHLFVRLVCLFPGERAMLPVCDGSRQFAAVVSATDLPYCKCQQARISIRSEKTKIDDVDVVTCLLPKNSHVGTRDTQDINSFQIEIPAPDSILMAVLRP